MYTLYNILSQIQKNLFQSFDAISQAPVGGSPAERELAANAVGIERDYLKMESSELLEELRKKLDSLKASEDILGTESEVLMRFAKKVKAGKEAGLSEADDDFIRLTDIIVRKVSEYRKLVEEGHQIQHLITHELHTLSGEVQKEIDNPEGNVVVDDFYIITDKTEIDYKPEDIEVLQGRFNERNQKVREIFFRDILGIEDNGGNLESNKDHPNIVKLRERVTEEGYQYGHDIDDIIDRYTLSIQAEEQVGLIEQGQALQLGLSVLSEVERELGIIARDTKEIDGQEETLGELRLRITHEGYKELLENTDIRQALEDGNGEVPNFEDLGMEHIMLIQEKGGDLRKLFLTQEDGTNFSGTSLEKGKKYIINFGANEKLADAFDVGFLDIGVLEITVDGKSLIFQKDGVRGAGFYDENNMKYPLKDGSRIEVIQRESLSDTEQQDIQTSIQEQMEYLAGRSTSDRMFQQAALGNPEAFFDGKTLPKGLFGTILAFIHNMIHKLTGKGEEYTYDEASGTWRSGDTVMTNQAVREGYIESFSGDMKLGSLSAEFESSSQGPYAYNPNDNGHGPSYGTYQMNTNKGVYREFARLHNIGPEQAGWNAAIEQHGVEKFKEMEHEFIKQKNYLPMWNKITISDKDNFSPAMKNVIWSIAVQHGPGNGSLNDIINQSGVKPGDLESEEKLIHALYDRRGEIWPAGIQSRYNTERVRAISMLHASLLVGASNDVYNQNIDVSKLNNFTSVPAQKNNTTGTPLCSRTTRLNFEKIGVRGVPRGGSAKESFEAYPSSKVDRTFPANIPENATVADVFCDASAANRQYGHRAIALKTPNGWMVYDPHYGFGNGTPVENYVRHMANTRSQQKMWGAVYYS